jgi:phenylpropionate dioxygenase-like ring-hydroxylating dioxygenase large terminal subunit
MDAPVHAPTLRPDVVAAPITWHKRGCAVPAQDAQSGYLQCWYPMALSAEVAPGQVVGKEFLNGRVVVYRGESGQPHVMSAFCRHMGVDLSLGRVEAENLRCVYHGWSYDSTGQCTHTALGDEPPRAAKLFRFPTAEKYGLIWAFNGETPTYDLPDFGIPESEIVWRAKEKEILPVESYVPFSNALDLQHLKVNHGLEVLQLPDDFDTSGHMIEYDIEFIIPMMGPSKQHIRMYAANSILISQQFMNRKAYMMSAGRAIPGGRTVIYNVNATTRSAGKPGEEQMIEAMLSAVETFGDRLQDEDRPVMHTISFRQDNFSASDKFLAAYMRFVREYPRSNVACDMVSCN